MGPFLVPRDAKFGTFDPLHCHKTAVLCKIVFQNRSSVSISGVMPLLESQSERHKQWGTCSVCFCKLSLTSANVIHSHGLNGPCAGSRFAPVDGSFTMRPSSDLAVKDSTANASVISSAVVSSESEAQALLDSVVKVQSSVLKYIPKASRVLAADKLSTLLDSICHAPNYLIIA